MKSMAKWLMAGAVLFLSFGLLGCCPKEESKALPGGAASKKRHRVALIMKTLSNPFFISMQEGAERAAEELNVDLITLAQPKETDADKQLDNIENMIAEKVDALLVAPADSKAVVAPLMKAQKAGLLVINIDNRIDPETAKAKGFSCPYIGADNEEGGYLAGKHLAKLLGGKGKVVILEGIRGVDNAEARRRGFEKAMAEHKDITIVDKQTANWDMMQGMDVFANMLASQPDIQGLFCANDMMALGAVRAIDEAKKTGQIYVVAYDNLKEAQVEIKKGTLHGTIEQHPDLMGGWGVRKAVEALEGKEIEKEILVTLELITAESFE